MGERFQHRYAGPWTDDIGDEDIHVIGLAGDTTGRWSGMNVIVGKDELLCPRPGLLHLGNWGSPGSAAWAGLSGPSIDSNKIYGALSGDAVVYEVDAEGGDTWASSGNSTTGATGDAWFLHVGDGETLVSRSGEVGELATFSTTLSSSVLSSGQAVIVAHDNRVYGRGAGEVAYSNADPTAAWQDSTPADLVVAPTFEGNYLEVDWVAAHDQGLFVLSNGGVFLLSGNPETGSFRQVAAFNTIRSLEAHGSRALAVGTDGTLLAWTGSTFEVVARQFQNDLAAAGFSQASTTRGNGNPIVLSEAGDVAMVTHGFFGEFLLWYNRRWTRHQFTNTTWSSSTSLAGGNMNLAAQFINGAPLRDSTASNMRHTFWCPMVIDIGGAKVRLGVLAFDDGTVGSGHDLWEPATSTDTPESDTTDANGAYTSTIDLPTRWAAAAEQFRLSRIAVNIRRSGNTESGNNEVTIKVTTFNRRKSTVTTEQTEVWSESESARDVDFIVWDLPVDVRDAGDGYQVSITKLVGCGIRSIEVFGDLEDGER